MVVVVARDTARQSDGEEEQTSFAEYFNLGSRRNIRPIKNGLKALGS